MSILPNGKSRRFGSGVIQRFTSLSSFVGNSHTMRLLLFISFAILVGQATSAKTHRKINGWFSCPTSTFSDQGSMGQDNAECATFVAPLCYPGICEAPESVVDTVDIFVKRLPADSGDASTATNVWLIQGGPGYSSSTLELDMLFLHAHLNGTVNVYTMDHRGTGRSTLFDCVASQSTTTGSPGANQIDMKEIPACAQSLQDKYGDLASFSTTSAAMDIVTFLSKYSNGASSIVYGTSYGTMLVERLMHLNPPNVIGYVLDGVATSSGAAKFQYYSKYDTDFGKVGDAFMAHCEEDKECKSRFGPNGLQDALQKLILKLDKQPNSKCAALLATAPETISNLKSTSRSKSTSGAKIGEPPSYTLRRQLGALLLDSTTRTLIPPIIYRLQRCSSHDKAVLKFFFKTMQENSNVKSQDSALTSILLFDLIVYSEMWESPQPSKKVMKKRFTDASMSDAGMYLAIEQYCAFSKEDSPLCNKLGVSDYEANGIIYERDEYWNKAATIPKGASVLLLQGKLDARTPSKYAEYLLEALIGTRKELITFDYDAHGIVRATQVDERGYMKPNCGTMLLTSYIANDGNLKKLDKSCVDKMPALNLTSPYETTYMYLSTDDAYDGKFIRRKSSSFTSQSEASS